MTGPLQIGDATLYTGDARECLQEIPTESVHMCVTSPPYWNLRNYGVAGQLGLERTPEEYVANTVDVFAAVRRVLRADGTLWLNIGDCYANDGKWGGNTSGKHAKGNHGETGIGRAKRSTGLKPKDLVGIPWMLAFALRADGWYLRSEIIWHKLNPMPEPVTDRPTCAHEKVFLFAKSADYFYDADAIREPLRPKTFTSYGTTRRSKGNDAAVKADNFGADVPERKPRLDDDGQVSGANKRNVWGLASEPCPVAHFATFPTELVKPCIMAGSSEFGCCEKCGAPWIRRVERTPMVVRETSRSAQLRAAKVDGRNACSGTVTQMPSARTIGCGCGCGCGKVPCTVLDPFNGAGTTGLVSLALGRRYVGIDLNPAYVEMSARRLRAATAQADLFRRPASVVPDRMAGTTNIADGTDGGPMPPPRKPVSLATPAAQEPGKKGGE